MTRLSASSCRSAPSLLASLFPPLARYWPNLPTCSPQQAAFLLLDQLEAFYGGSAGGGKSDALLAAALQYVDHPSYQALILRRTLAELALPGAIMARSHEWLAGTDARWNDDRKTWRFPSGATVTFGYAENQRDIYRYQGSDWLFVGWDELTQFPPEPYEYLFSRLRRNAGVSVPLRVRAAANPGGVGHQWVLDRFPIAEGRGPADCDGRVFIPARVHDNPGLDAAEYERSLSNLSDVLRAQLMNGDWGAFEGAAYPMFSPDVHVVGPFDVPDAWERFESMDFGTTNPTCWLAWAVDYDGNLVTFAELYRPGLPSETAPLVLEARESWHPDGLRPVVFADPSVFGKTGVTNRWGRPATVADEFADHGVDLVAANNDRRAGYVRLAQLLRPDPARRFPAWHPRAGEFGCPRWFVFSGCRELISQLRAAPLEGATEVHPGEAVSRRWEGPYGHAHAAARYGAMSRPGPSDMPEPQLDPRAELLLQVERNRELPVRDKMYVM